jgi:hypothetical protein
VKRQVRRQNQFDDEFSSFQHNLQITPIKSNIMFQNINIVL